MSWGSAWECWEWGAGRWHSSPGWTGSECGSGQEEEGDGDGDEEGDEEGDKDGEDPWSWRGKDRRSCRSSGRNGKSHGDGRGTSWVWPGEGAGRPVAPEVAAPVLVPAPVPVPVPAESLLSSMEEGYLEEEFRVEEAKASQEGQGPAGVGGRILDILRLLPNKEWVPFSSAEQGLEPQQGAFGAPAGPAVEFYLRPSLMPVGGFFSWRAHHVYQKDLAFLKKDSLHEIRLNKEIATRWTAKELLDFAEIRGCEFDVANVITTIHRIAKASDRWYVKKDPRLHQLFTQAVDTVCDSAKDSTARDLAKTQWSMGRLKHSDRLIRDKLAGQVLRRLDELQPQGLSNILWSYAYTGPPPQASFLAIVEDFRRKMSACDPQALSNVSWTLAKLLFPHPPMLDEISLEAMGKVESFDPQGLANLAWSFATLQHSSEALFACLIETLLQDPSRWQPQNMANFLWAAAKLLVTHQKEHLLEVVGAEMLATMDNWNYQGLANVSWALANLRSSQNHLLLDAISGAVVRKIASFTPQNTVNVAWAFAKLGYAGPNLMRAVARDVVAKSKDYSPQQCSNAAWAFGMAGILEKPAMESLARVAEWRVMEFNAQDIANLVWACAKLAWSSPKLLEVLGQDARAKVHTFTPQNTAIVSWSFGCLAVSSEPMMALVSVNFLERIPEFGSQGLANMAHGLAKQAIRDEVMMQRVATETVRSIQAFSNQEFSTTVWAFAKLKVLDASLMEAVLMELRARMPDLIPQDLAMLAWSFVHFEAEAPESRQALEEMSWEVLRQAVHLCPQDLSNICWAYATACFENAMMMDALAQESIKKVAHFSAQDLANVSWAFSRLSFSEDTMFDAISEEVVKKVHTLLPQNLSIISWAYAKLGLLNEPMMETISGEVLRRIKDFDGQGAGNIVWSFAVLGLRRPGAIEAMFCAVMERSLKLVPTLTAQEVSNIAWGLATLRRWELLRLFLPTAVGHFLAVVTGGEGASCTDLTNAVSSLISRDEDAEVRDVFTRLDAFYRENIFEPLLEKLGALRSKTGDLAVARAEVQAQLDATGAPYFGAAYTREALVRLQVIAPREKEGWMLKARRCCLEVLRDWRIPSARSIITFASWNVWRQTQNDIAEHLVEDGKVFQSSWAEGISQEVKDLLQPFKQAVQRDMYSERVALLELVDAMVHAARGSTGTGNAKEVLSSYKGTVQIYLSHFPSLSSVGVFCQFMRHCPGVWLAFGFDDAWHTCCGVPRFGRT